MKQTIKIKVLTEGCVPTIIENGEWIDLKAAQDMYIAAPNAETLKRHDERKYRAVSFNNELIPLGVAMQLPKGYEAVVVPRSSSYKKWKLVQSNSVGVIDNSYSGNDDQWMFPAIAFSGSKIKKGDRICQFRIQLSQKATIWQKLKWLFSNGIKIEIVDDLNSSNRGGFGSTGSN